MEERNISFGVVSGEFTALNCRMTDFLLGKVPSSAGWQDGENDYTPFVTYMLGVMTACYKELDRRFAIAAGPKGGEGMLRAYFEQLVGAATKRDIMDANPSISKRTVERVLKKLQDDGTIEKTGSARSTAYRKR